MKYRLGKLQVRRLINGGYVADGRGKRYTASKELREALKDIDDKDLYGNIDIFLEDGLIDVARKSGEVNTDVSN